MISLNIDFTKEFISEKEISKISVEVLENFEKLKEGSGQGNEFLGWIDLPEHKDAKCLSRITALAEKLKAKTDIVIVIGIGGSYLGARAVIEALQSPFSNLMDSDNPQIVYAGHQLDAHYLNELLKLLDQKDYALVVISKSGTTTEPAIAFRALRSHLENKYGQKEASERIIAITDQTKGALRTLSKKQNYESFYIPDNVGGRYSVLTPVGLLPIALAGFDVKQIMAGAKAMKDFIFQEKSILENPAFLYVAIRNILYRKEKSIEVMINYQSDLYYLTEWWKQLFGESEGKEAKGIFPIGVNFTTDLHSLGQYLQEGHRYFFETILDVQEPKSDYVILSDKENLDGLNYLQNKSIHYVNQKAAEGTAMAHNEGGIPIMKLQIPKINEYYLGQLIYLFEISCGISGYMLGVNPFDQPGVEAYKSKMFELLDKPK